jgi:hypothetical protein
VQPVADLGRECQVRRGELEIHASPARPATTPAHEMILLDYLSI